MFDRVCILSKGRTVYFGAVEPAKAHFSAAGVPCPPFHNPADHYLEVVNIDFDAAALNGASGKSSDSAFELLVVDPVTGHGKKKDGVSRLERLVEFYNGSPIGRGIRK